MKPNTKNIPTLPIGLHRYDRGVYLRVTPSSRSWILKYQINGRRREMGLGPAEGQAISAVAAKVSAARFQINQGVDPLDCKAENKRVLKEEVKKKSAPTFGSFAPKAVDRIFKVRLFASRITESSWLRSVRELTNAFGSLKLSDITTEDVVKFLEPHWGHPRKARDLQGRLSNILDVAVTEGYITNNPAKWDFLKHWLPSLNKVRKSLPENHHAAVTAEELSRLAKTLWEKDTVWSLALLFGFLTVGRCQEWRLAEWSEIDTENLTLSVPPARRKDGRSEPHIVPLSRQSQEILKRLDTSSPFLFPGRKGDKSPITNCCLIRRLKSMTDMPITVHGTRSTFSDWCAKNNKNFLLSEKQLMHAVGNEVFRAYQRDDLLEQRRVLMQEWADYLLPDV